MGWLTKPSGTLGSSACHCCACQCFLHPSWTMWRTYEMTISGRYQHVDADPAAVDTVVFTTCSGMHHHGMKQLEMWMQTLVPGTAIPPHTHGGEEVVIVLKVTPPSTLPGNFCKYAAAA